MIRVEAEAADVPVALHEACARINEGGDPGVRAALASVVGTTRLGRVRASWRAGYDEVPEAGRVAAPAPAVLVATPRRPVADLPVKVLHEYYTCVAEAPRCRARARVYMDGLGYCLEHRDRIPYSLEPFAMRIEYQVAT